MRIISDSLAEMTDARYHTFSILHLNNWIDFNFKKEGESVIVQTEADVSKAVRREFAALAGLCGPFFLVSLHNLF